MDMRVGRKSEPEEADGDENRSPHADNKTDFWRWVAVVFDFLLAQISTERIYEHKKLVTTVKTNMLMKGWQARPIKRPIPMPRNDNPVDCTLKWWPFSNIIGKAWKVRY